MTLGTNDKTKTGILIGLGLIAIYMVYANLLSSPAPSNRTGSSAPAAPANPAPKTQSPTVEPSAKTTPRTAANRNRSSEFHPVFRSTRPGADRPDPLTVDPTLRLDLLAKVQHVSLAGGSRNLFQFSTPPPKELPKLDGAEPKVFVGPVKPPEPAAAPPPPGPPPPPPITLKFYGYSATRSTGKKTAYFLDGEDILMGSEGDTLKRRYKVVRIGPNSVVLEDTDAKRQQSIPLTEEAAEG